MCTSAGLHKQFNTEQKPGKEFIFQATTEDNNFSSLKIYLFSMQQQMKCLSRQRHFVAESGQYPFLHSDPKFFQFPSSYTFSIYSYTSMLEQKPQFLQVALMYRGVYIFFI